MTASAFGWSLLLKSFFALPPCLVLFTVCLMLFIVLFCIVLYFFYFLTVSASPRLSSSYSLHSLYFLHINKIKAACGLLWFNLLAALCSCFLCFTLRLFIVCFLVGCFCLCPLFWCFLAFLSYRLSVSRLSLCPCLLCLVNKNNKIK